MSNLVRLALIAVGTVVAPCASAQSGFDPGLPAGASDFQTFGRAEPDWRLVTLEGDELDLGDRFGRVIFLNVWATWCRPCVVELAGIAALADSMRARGVEIDFMLVTGERREQVARYVAAHRVTLPVYLEVEEMPPSFNLLALPTTYVIDHRGEIVLQRRGAADWNLASVREFLTALGRAAAESQGEKGTR